MKLAISRTENKKLVNLLLITATSALAVTGLLILLTPAGAQAAGSAPNIDISQAVVPAESISSNSVLTYTIGITNNSEASESLWLMNQIPEQTTYISGSVTPPAEYRECLATLSTSGIFWSGEITAHSQIAVSFQVEVDAIPEDTLILPVENTVYACDGEWPENCISDTLRIEARGTCHVYLPVVTRAYCWLDPYEPNNTFEESTSINSGQIIRACFCSGDSDDLYRIAISETTTVQIDLTNVPSETDLDLYLYSPSHELVAWSNEYGGGVAESIEYDITAGSTGTYFIRVYPYQLGPDAFLQYELTASW